MLETIQSRHRIERRQIADEQRAFESFAREVRSLPSDAGHQSPVPAIAAQPAAALESSSATGLELVADAYRSTVMSVPHYDEEYGDTYAESVIVEFGPTVGSALTEGSRFDQHCRDALLAAVQQAVAERAELLEVIDIEEDSVEAVSRTIDPVIEGLDSFESVAFDEQDFGSLDAYRARLSVLSERCDRAAADRQAAIRDQRNDLKLPTEAPDVPTYLYRSFETRYPLLSLIATLCERIEQVRRAVETSAATCRC
jgi:hypothetical protein